MSWVGPWLGGGAATPAVAPAVGARRPGNAFERIVKVLQTEFPRRDRTGPQVYVGIAQTGGPGIVVVRQPPLNSPATHQAIRVAVQFFAQAATVEELESIHSRAMAALFDSDEVPVVQHEIGADFFDDEIGQGGVYRRATTLEVRA